MSDNKSFLSPISKIKGLGSAKEGSHHWLMQRITAIAILALIIPFACHFADSKILTYEYALEFMKKPFVALGGILLYIAAFYHGALGIRVIIEDYIHKKCIKMAMLIASQLLCFAGAATGVFAILSIYFKG